MKIIKRYAQGDASQASIIFETNSNILIRDNIRELLDSELDPRLVEYDEYVIKKEHYDIFLRLALANFPPLDDNEKRVFEILREYHNKEV